MSHKHHVPQATGVMHDITVLSSEELTEQYGIELEDDKSVWDPVEGQRFKNLQEWAEFVAEQDDTAYGTHFEKMGHKHAFDDGY